MAYRTEDNYYISEAKTVDNFDLLYEKASKEHEIDFEFPLDEVKSIFDGGSILHSTYRAYPKLLFIIHEIIGSYDIEITFSGDQKEFGYSQSTEVNFSVSEDGVASYSLYNNIEPDELTADGEPAEEGTDEYAAYKEAKDIGFTMFASDKSVDFNMSDLSLEEFVAKIDS